MKTQVIDFREFVSGEYRQQKKIINSIPLFTLAYNPFVVSPSSIFSPPPMITKAYLLMISVGTLLIGMATIEKYLGTNGFTKIASSIFNTIQTLMPLILIGAIIYFVFANPLLGGL
ncbi:hypothetical protein ACJ2A9_04775 [Anaerobacillus sp. MEB173]|uniref:hypothetical protein n=1 Tax=Anaerobacillus sp. MEB173 TaxID=3383345 RepID=UPI003F905594